MLDFFLDGFVWLLGFCLHAYVREWQLSANGKLRFNTYVLSSTISSFSQTMRYIYEVVKVWLSCWWFGFIHMFFPHILLCNAMHCISINMKKWNEMKYWVVLFEVHLFFPPFVLKLKSIYVKNTIFLFLCYSIFSFLAITHENIKKTSLW